MSVKQSHVQSVTQPKCLHVLHLQDMKNRFQRSNWRAYITSTSNSSGYNIKSHQIYSIVIGFVIVIMIVALFRSRFTSIGSKVDRLNNWWRLSHLTSCLWHMSQALVVEPSARENAWFQGLFCCEALFHKKKCDLPMVSFNETISHSIK